MISGEPQPHEFPSMSASTSAVRPIESVAMPGRSIRRSTVSSRDSRVANSVTATAPTATGRLRKKIARHETCSVRKPPTTGPIASASPDTPAHVPIALPRISGGNAFVMIDRVAGIMNAAPIALDRAPRHEPGLIRGEADRRARGREHGDAEEEHPPAPEDVAEPAARHEEDGEGQRVGVDRPLEARERRIEVRLDRRQRDVHDRVVEHDHEQREAHRGERPPAAVGLGQADAIGHARRSRIGSRARARRSRSSSVSVSRTAPSSATRISSRRSIVRRPLAVRLRRLTLRSALSSARRT